MCTALHRFYITVVVIKWNSQPDLFHLLGSRHPGSVAAMAKEMPTPSPRRRCLPRPREGMPTFFFVWPALSASLALKYIYSRFRLEGIFTSCRVCVVNSTEVMLVIVWIRAIIVPVIPAV